ncbi:hypothetical protein N7478_010517 [Penicillium angulare]|uniref:uncharacterized protein n=1 Tax=Penicillium angulare TaxID=116970 RepID=UPI002541A5CA|nr:uncharacterized protein N7478_010517 [Penicillium angulare]KAJ5267709.1 hypothetical protein N7478_010517 [Penicillium angulare]
MRLFLSLFAGSMPVVFAATFHLFDVNGKCLIYSVGNLDCTGSSEPFANLIGRNCYFGQSTADEPRTVNVTICDQTPTNGHSAATVRVDQTGLISFQNQEGQVASCSIESSFQVGSVCTAGYETMEQTTNIPNKATQTTATHSTLTKGTSVPVVTTAQPSDC